MEKRIGVLLSGCGVMDGTEIHEAVLTLYFLQKAGAEIICMAQDKDQRDVINHLGNAPVAEEKRNIMTESARIARGKIRDVSAVKAEELDALVIPGGCGAIKNLSSFAVDGAACEVDENVRILLRELYKNKKPIGALCLSPIVVAAVFGKICAPEITIGSDDSIAAALEVMGARHKTVASDEIVIDSENGIITCPCYMTAQNIGEVGAGIEKLIEKIMEMV